MIELHNCPSLLADGYSTYCPKAIKLLFDGKRVSHVLNVNIDEFRNTGEIARAVDGNVDFPQIVFEKGATEERLSKVSKSGYHSKFFINF